MGFGRMLEYIIECLGRDGWGTRVALSQRPPQSSVDGHKGEVG